MIRLRGQLICMNEGEAALVRQHLPEHLRLTRLEPGCLTFEVTPSDDPLIWEVVEAFRTRPDFEAHQTRTRNSAWFEATRHILRNFMVEEIGD